MASDDLITFDELKHGDVINPPKSLQWGAGVYVVDGIHPSGESIFVACYVDGNEGIGTIERGEYKPTHFVRQMSDEEIRMFDTWIKEVFPG